MTKINKILKNSLFLQCMQDLEQAEKDRIFCRHGIEHLLSVARIMHIYALEKNMNIDKETIYAAALLHDTGRVRAYRLHTDHAKESADIARQILRQCDFENAEINKIVFAVLHHNDCETPDELCLLLRTADKQSRNCFLCPAYDKCNWDENKKNKEVII